MSETQLTQIPTGAVLAHYAQVKPGQYAVVNVKGQILAPSFYDLRHQFTASATIAGAGCWVVLEPIQQFKQASLF